MLQAVDTQTAGCRSVVLSPSGWLGCWQLGSGMLTAVEVLLQPGFRSPPSPAPPRARSSRSSDARGGQLSSQSQCPAQPTSSRTFPVATHCARSGVIRRNCVFKVLCKEMRSTLKYPVILLKKKCHIKSFTHNNYLSVHPTKRLKTFKSTYKYRFLNLQKFLYLVIDIRILWRKALWIYLSSFYTHIFLNSNLHQRFFTLLLLLL